jgi:nicotinamidase-related amidase
MSNLRVLIVVDVQQCFIEGTLGASPEHESDMAKFKAGIINFVKKRKHEYDVIVFTKDLHPPNHSSYQLGIYTPHCTNCSEGVKSCIPRTKYAGLLNNPINPDINMLTDDMYSFEGQLSDCKTTKRSATGYESEAGKELIAEFEDKTLMPYNEKISLDLTKFKFDTAKSLNDLATTGRRNDPFMDVQPYSGKGPYVIRLNKGELCNFDANGAFYYHVEYAETGDKSPLREHDILKKENSHRFTKNITQLSTGLAESLKIRADNLFKTRMDIDVCGLVTNICVAKTCITGVEMFKALKMPNVTFRIMNEYCYNLNIPTEYVQNAYNQLQEYIAAKKVSFTNIKDAHGFHPKYHTFDTFIRQHPNIIDVAFRPLAYESAVHLGGNRINKGISKRRFTTIRKSRNQRKRNINRKRSLRR